MLKIRTLQNIPLEEISACHNLAFSDYIIPLQITAEHLASAIQANSILLEFSPGAFDGDKLVGFMLIGVNKFCGQKAFYNGGTGVVPVYRGRQIVKELYSFLLPLLKRQQVEIGVLEVITKNKHAYRIYEALGYRTCRKFLCFKGTVATNSEHSRVAIKSIHEINFDYLKSFWDWQPSWQNDFPAMRNILAKLHWVGAFMDEEMVGYLIYNPIQKRTHQFAVNKPARRQNVGAAMFAYIAEHFGAELAVINVDCSDAPSISFLESMGLELFAEQYEMKLPVGVEV